MYGINIFGTLKMLAVVLLIVKISLASPPLYAFWTGTNNMSAQRHACFETMSRSEMNVTLITENNLANYIESIGVPLHAGYKYLSETHKADYLRTYFMHFVGGGYCDIKTINHSWLPSYNKLYESDEHWGIGYKEVGSWGVAHHSVVSNWEKLIGNGAYIFKPKTNLTTEWYNQMIRVMDSKFDKLEQYPSRRPQETYSSQYPYPLGWAELLGEIFHPINYKYHSHVLQTLPPPMFSGYR